MNGWGLLDCLSYCYLLKKDSTPWGYIDDDDDDDDDDITNISERGARSGLSLTSWAGDR
jgi:hypothetical protein